MGPGPDAERTAAPIAETVTRAPGPRDAVDDVRPEWVVRPGTPEAFAAALGAAAHGRQSVVIRGGGTKLGWGRPPAPIDVLLETGGLDRVITHRHGDMTATVEAGAALTDVQRSLASHGQWLPIDSAFDAATIGGLIATNDSGPLRHRHGTPRDLVIGVTLATTDGRLVKAGGQVVKNVAGYDLGKLVSGSFGSLAAIVTATFKLAPLPPAPMTLSAEFADGPSMALAVARILASQMEPLAFDLHVECGPVPTRTLLLRFASTPRAVAHQCAEAAQVLAPAVAVLSDGETEAAIWRSQLRGIWSRPGAVLRAAWPVAALPVLIERLKDEAAHGDVVIELSGRAGVGAGLIRVDGDLDAQARIVARLRSAAPAIGAVSVLRADRSLKARVDVWGAPSGAALALRAIKQAFDPAGILNAGRGPI